MSLDNILLIPGVGGEKGLLDLYPGAAAAYSLRKLRNAYSGPCVRVRRASDNAEQDIGFAGNVMDAASLLDFVGAGDGFVTTWYDQAVTSAGNATQATTTLQPRIVASGVLETSGGKSVINVPTPNVNIHLVYPFNPRNQTCDFFSVAALPSDPILDSRIVFLSAVDSDPFVVPTHAGSSDTVLTSLFSSLGLRKNGLPQTITTRGQAFSAYNVGNLVQIGISGSFNDDVKWSNVKGRRVFGFFLGTSFFNATVKFSEVIIYFTDQSSNRAAIDENQVSRWGIT